ERYRGEMELIDPIAGHIPGAINRFTGENLRDDGCFKSGAELRSEFLKLMQNVPPEHTVVYCGSGVTSCHHLVALEHAGLPGVRLYLGSWSQWIRDPNRAREPMGLTSNAG
ncbi:MAG: rhodanese-like domain-containing protein, partial [Anaerolineaceae bacterium]|nr:rhodanese-like domain-containing protein [Anaerolineaceae bacterium]